MKKFLALCAALSLTVVATYLVVSSQKAAQFARERDLLKSSWDAERAELEAALKGARQRSNPARFASSEPILDNASAHDLLDRLKKTKVLAGALRIASIRHVVHHLESLADLGPEALPAIREFLGKFEDVDYSGETRDDERDPMRDPDAKTS